MSTGRNAEMQVSDLMPTVLQLKKKAAGRYRVVSWLFAREAVKESVATRVHFETGPEAVWNELMFYEEVPGRAPLLLRALLAEPERTEGDKRRVGAAVRCVYSGGAELVKRITSVEAQRLLRFEVVEQRLGIEDCILTLGGSYQVDGCGDGTDVMLMTNYHAYLRPRSLWRPVEAALVSQLHKHILRGVSVALQAGNEGLREALASSLPPKCGPAAGGLACTVSQSSSRR